MLSQLRVDDTEAARDVGHQTHMGATTMFLHHWRIEQYSIVLKSACHSKNLQDFGRETHFGDIRYDSLHDVRRL